MMRIISTLLLSLPLFCYSGISTASTLAWWDTTLTNNRHPDYQTACNEYGLAPSGYFMTYTFKTVNGKPAVDCAHKRLNPAHVVLLGQVHQFNEICEFGDNGTQCNTSCDAPNEMVDGQCIIDPDHARCQALEGQQTQGTTTGNVNDPDASVGRAGNNYYNKKREYNVGGCKVDVGLGGSGGKCVFKPDGTYACKFPVGYTGEVAASETDMDELPEDPEPEKTSDTDQGCSAWSDGGSGTRSKSCTSTSTASEDGSSTCQRGDYNMTCYRPTPTPESDTNTREDEITETSNPDGGKTTVTDSTTTNTHCTDGSCNSTTTNTSTTVVTDGNGNVTGESSTCSGANCADPGGDGDGDGEGDGSGEEESFASPGGGEFGSVSDALPAIGEEGDKSYSEATQEYTDRIKASPIVSSVLNISVPSGGTCSIGSASLFGGSINFNYFCTMAPDVLSGLRYLFLAIWAWAAIRLLMTA